MKIGSVFVLLTIISMIGMADARTIIVDASGGEDYTKIQDAIDASSAGDTILVYSGTYYENVNVEKRLMLRGIGMPVVNAGKKGSAIVLAGDNSTLEGFNITNSKPNFAGIEVASQNNIIRNNVVYNGPGNGIELLSSSNSNTIVNNTLTNNWFGIELEHSNNNTITHNTLSNNGHGIWIRGKNKTDYDNVIDDTNLVNGKPVYYYFDQHDIVVDRVETSHLTLAYSYNFTIKDSKITGGDGIQLAFTNDSTVKDNIVNSNQWAGIDLENSKNNTIVNNSISNSLNYGILISDSSYNVLVNNNITNSLWENILVIGERSHYDNIIDTSNLINGKPVYYYFGEHDIVVNDVETFHLTIAYSSNITIKNSKVSKDCIRIKNTDDSTIENNTVDSNICADIYLQYSNNNIVRSNIVKSNFNYGISLLSSNNNTIIDNNVSNSNGGVYLFSSNNNTIIYNNDSNNNGGIFLFSSNANKIYNNNFVNNRNQAIDNTGTNSWSSVYSSGGNYWSDYNGADSNSDGIGDTPYNISGGTMAQDLYPFIRPDGWILVTPMPTPTGSPVPTPTPTPIPTPIYDDYDTNDNGKIDRNEAVQAVIDYFNGTISKQLVIDIVIEYFSGT